MEISFATRRTAFLTFLTFQRFDTRRTMTIKNG